MRPVGLTMVGTALWLSSTLAVVAETVPVPMPAPKRPVPAATTPAAPDARPQTAVEPAQPLVPVPLTPPAASTMPVLAGTPPAARPGEPAAFDAKQRAMLDRVSAYLSSVQTLTGDFVQVGPDGQRSEGQFFIQKPGKVRFEYNAPSAIEIIADGQSVVVRDRNLATQDLYPLSQTPLRFLLSDRIDLLKDTHLVSVSIDDVFITVVIEEKHALVGTHRLMLMFGAKDFQLRQWTVTDPQGYDTTVAVYNLDATKKPDPAMFKINYTERPDPR